jgi:hypothetical protein
LLARIAVNRNMSRVAVLLEIQGAECVRQGACVNDAQRFGQRRVTGRRARDEAELSLLSPGEAASEKKRSLHPAPSAQHRNHNQAEDRPKSIISALSAARVRNLLQNKPQLHEGPPRIKKPLSNQKILCLSSHSTLSINRPGHACNRIDHMIRASAQ